MARRGLLGLLKTNELRYLSMTEWGINTSLTDEINRRKELARLLALEAVEVAPALIYCPGSRWVTPVIFHTNVKVKVLPRIYQLLLMDLEGKSGGYVRWRGWTMGLRKVTLSSIQAYIQLLVTDNC